MWWPERKDRQALAVVQSDLIIAGARDHADRFAVRLDCVLSNKEWRTVQFFCEESATTGFPAMLDLRPDWGQFRDIPTSLFRVALAKTGDARTSWYPARSQSPSLALNFEKTQSRICIAEYLSAFPKSALPGAPNHRGPWPQHRGRRMNRLLACQLQAYSHTLQPSGFCKRSLGIRKVR